MISSFESLPRQCHKDCDKAEQWDACLKEWLHIVSCILMLAANTHALHAVVDHLGHRDACFHPNDKALQSTHTTQCTITLTSFPDANLLSPACSFVARPACQFLCLETSTHNVGWHDAVLDGF